jgi:hypothetical protein
MVPKCLNTKSKRRFNERKFKESNELQCCSKDATSNDEYDGIKHDHQRRNK